MPDWLYASWINILLILGLNANKKRCHGVEGLGYLPGDLTGAEIQTILLVTPGEYLCRVAEGLDGMPSFKRKMTEDEIWQVYTFTSTLGQ
jgi:mono/diheme cytochrome c family protein